MSRDRVSALHPNTGAALHDERVIAVREEPNLHLEFYQRDVTAGIRSPWKLPPDAVSKSSQESITVAKKLESEVQPVIGLGFHSSAIEDVDHEALHGFCKRGSPTWSSRAELFGDGLRRVP